MAGSDMFMEITNKDIYTEIVGLKKIFSDHCKNDATFQEKVANNEKNIAYLFYAVAALSMFLMGTAVL